MRSIAARTLVALCATGIFASRSDAATGSISSDPLTVYITCQYSMCQAEASGGSGTGYSFAWTRAVEHYDADGYSEAAAVCTTYRGTYVQVTVTDSNGSTASAGAVTCDENDQEP